MMITSSTMSYFSAKGFPSSFLLFCFLLFFFLFSFVLHTYLFFAYFFYSLLILTEQVKPGKQWHSYFPGYPYQQNPFKVRSLFYSLVMLTE